MSTFDGKTDAQNGWISGWTLSARAEHLERETSSPLEVTFCQSRFMIECSAPGVDTVINFTPTGRSRCRVCARGFRVIDEHADQDVIASCLKLDATSLVIESDKPLIQPLLDSDEFEHSGNESLLYIGDGQYHLAMLIDRKADPVRLTVVAGTGNRESMLSRARGHLSVNVHQEVDLLLKSAYDDTSGIRPAEYIKSRMRAATRQIPHPWLSDVENEPVWNLGSIYLVTLGLLPDEESFAGGLINNLLEMMDVEGMLPIAGGNISQPFNGPPAYPLLARLILGYYQQSRQWPADLDHTLDQIHRYLNNLKTFAADPANRTAIPDHFPTFFRNEVSSLAEIYRVSGRSPDEPLRGLLVNTITETNPPDKPPDRATDLLTSFIAEVTGKSPAIDQVKTAKIITDELATGEHDHEPDIWLLTIVAAENYRQSNYRGYSAWITELNSMAQKRWSAFWLRIETAPELLHEPGLMALAGFLAWSDDAKQSAFDPVMMRQQTLTSFVLRRKKWLFGASIAAILILGAFILSVQFRVNMPKSIFETNYGMAVQLYQTGMYEQALEIIADMENRGAKGNPVLVAQKGKIFYQQKRFPEAIECFEFCRDKSPDNPAYSYNLGLSYYQHGDLDSALLIFDSIMTTFKTAHPALATRASIAYATINDMQKNRSARPAPQKR